MYHLLVVCLIWLSANTFAHTNANIDLGDEANKIRESGKTYHQSISIIRKMHPEFLLHKRDKTSRQGVRTEENSLKGCVSCHANKNQDKGKYHPVNQTGKFCSTCHEEVGVSLDCFSCHRTIPKGAEL